MEKIELLKVLTDSMDIPENRRNFENEHNIRWFLRNASIRNSANPNLNEAVDVAKDLLRNGLNG